ncbi:MAG: PQQ-binding-like beta-propeller repeat protein [Planctomycetaceae bacterium]
MTIRAITGRFSAGGLAVAATLSMSIAAAQDVELPRPNVEPVPRRLVAQIPQQRVAPKPPRFANSTGPRDASRLPKASRRDVRLYRSALQRLEDGQPEEAVVYFQTILDADGDGFFEIDDTGRLVSLRGETIRRIETLADEAKLVYVRRYEPAAKGLLSDAISSDSAEQLTMVARRFPTTNAGREAAYRIALAHLDRGETLAAVARFEKLRDQVTAEQRIGLLMRLAACYGRLGAVERRDAIVQLLIDAGDDVEIAGRSIAASNADALRRTFDDATTSASLVASSDWPIAGGDAGRTSYRDFAIGPAVEWSVPGLPDPFLTPGAVNSPLQTQLHRWSAQTALLELASGQPAVPSARPIAVEGTVYFRTPANLVAVDAASGKQRWRSLADPLCWDYLTGEVPQSPEGEVAARTFVGQRLWSDATWGMTSADGQVVFAVEETGAANPLPSVPDSGSQPSGNEPVLPVIFNRLVAYETATGRRIWEAGGPPGRDATLSGTFFCGAPVPTGGHWFVLGEIAGVTHLIALAPTRPDCVLWSQPIAEHDVTVDHDVVRRTGGLSPCIAGGLLVCPVGVNLVVAVDPSTRSLLWAWSSPGNQAADRDGDPTIGGGRRRSIAPFGNPTEAIEVVAAGRDVLIASPQTGLSAVDAIDGSLRWRSTEFACLWPIGLDGENVFLQTPTGVAAIRLTDGSPAWPSPAVIGPPSGRGVIVDDRLYVPLADATLAVLDTATGRVITAHPAPRHELFGNLIVVGKSLISQSATRLVALPLEE